MGISKKLEMCRFIMPINSQRDIPKKLKTLASRAIFSEIYTIDFSKVEAKRRRLRDSKFD